MKTIFGIDTRDDDCKPIVDMYIHHSLPFYAMSQGIRIRDDVSKAAWFVCLKGYVYSTIHSAGGTVSGPMPFDWAVEKCDAMNAAVEAFYKGGL